MPYVVSLKQFDGPLDLLLTLISNAKVDIQDIFVSEITEQYLETMKLVDELDMESASEFLQMAATLLEISFNKYAFYGVEGLNIYGLLNDPNLNADITPTTGANGNTWEAKSADEIMSDFAKMYGKLYERSNGWIDGNTRTKLVIAPAALAELNKVNAFGASVKKMLADTYPNMEILSAPEMVTGSGNLAMILADEVNGQPTVEFGYSEKYKAHSIIRDSSSMYQKISAGTYGAIVYMPFAIVTMLGV
jgi:hypothetical protein